MHPIPLQHSPSPAFSCLKLNLPNLFTLKWSELGSAGKYMFPHEKSPRPIHHALLWACVRELGTAGNRVGMRVGKREGDRESDVGGVGERRRSDGCERDKWTAVSAAALSLASSLLLSISLSPSQTLLIELSSPPPHQVPRLASNQSSVPLFPPAQFARLSSQSLFQFMEFFHLILPRQPIL